MRGGERRDDAQGFEKSRPEALHRLPTPAAVLKDGAWAQFPILAKVNNIDTAKVRVENVGFPVREALLAQGRVDAVTAFGSNALGVVAQGVPESEVVVLMMRRFGLDLYRRGVARRDCHRRPGDVRG